MKFKAMTHRETRPPISCEAVTPNEPQRKNVEEVVGRVATVDGDLKLSRLESLDFVGGCLNLNELGLRHDFKARKGYEIHTWHVG